MRFLLLTKGNDFFWLANKLRNLLIGNESDFFSVNGARTLYVASDDELGLPSVWQHAPHVELQRVKGDHFSFVLDNKQLIARMVDAWLSEGEKATE